MISEGFHFALKESEQCYKFSPKENGKRADGHADCTERKSTLSEDLQVRIRHCGLMCSENNASEVRSFFSDGREEYIIEKICQILIFVEAGSALESNEVLHGQLVG